MLLAVVTVGDVQGLRLQHPVCHLPDDRGVQPRRLPDKGAVEVISCQPLFCFLKDRCALYCLAIGCLYFKFSLQCRVITELGDINGLLVVRAFETARGFNCLVCLGIPEVILEVLAVRLHILLGKEFFSVEPNEEGQVRLLLHEFGIVFLLLYNGVADGRRKIRVAPHPDGHVEIRPLGRGHVMVGVHHDHPPAVVPRLLGEMGVGYPHGDVVLGPRYQAVRGEPVIERGTYPADHDRVSPRIGVAHHGGNRGVHESEQPHEPLAAPLGELAECSVGEDSRSGVFKGNFNNFIRYLVKRLLPGYPFPLFLAPFAGPLQRVFQEVCLHHVV